MPNKPRICICMLLTMGAILRLPVVTQSANQQSSRCGGYGYREAVDIVIKRLQLKSGSVVVDIGAGDGWWSAKIAEQVGSNGTVYAAEVEQKKVNAMKTKWADIPQIKPYLCPMDGTGLEPDTCDMAFISKTYHHFDKDKHIDYLKHLKQVIKPSGKLVIIECHPALAKGRGKQHTWPPGLLAKQAEDAGWMLLKCDLIPRSDHYMAIFVQPESFAKKFEKRKSAPIIVQEEE